MPSPTGTLLNNRAALHHALGNYAEAEPLYRRALAIRKKAIGPEHPDVVQSPENYVALLRETDWTKQAAELKARAKATRTDFG